ncbi:hypothetical protein B0H14DRAFT_2578654 [Mycena olivaceomarginata]|nr:hypothetical protein B0H14DRAFT_2578654 [Mycena olivaceomarginata]
MAGRASGDVGIRGIVCGLLLIRLAMVAWILGKTDQLLLIYTRVRTVRYSIEGSRLGGECQAAVNICRSGAVSAGIRPLNPACVAHNPKPSTSTPDICYISSAHFPSYHFSPPDPMPQRALLRRARAGNRTVYGHGRGQHGRAKTRPSYYGPGGDKVLLHTHTKTVVSPHGPHGLLPCRVRAACQSLTSSTARLRNRITVPYSVLPRLRLPALRRAPSPHPHPHPRDAFACAGVAASSAAADDLTHTPTTTHSSDLHTVNGAHALALYAAPPHHLKLPPVLCDAAAVPPMPQPPYFPNPS